MHIIISLTTQINNVWQNSFLSTSWSTSEKHHLHIPSLSVGSIPCDSSPLRCFSAFNGWYLNSCIFFPSASLPKRTKTLSLTKNGISLENQLSTIQINKIKKVINNFNHEDINGFKKILYDMIEIDSKKTFQHLNEW